MAGKILKFLPKAASFSIPNHNSNSNRSKHMFSGPIVPMIPDHCRRKGSGMLEEEEEPTSPKVSCIGQVNHNKKSNNSKKKKKMMMRMKKEEEEEEQQQKMRKKKEAPKRTTSSIGGMFWRKAKPARPRDVDDSSDDEQVVGAPGNIGSMRRYASGREALKDFDWRTIGNDVDHEEKEAVQLVPHSAPILVGGGAVALEPKKKEMNIWMRRTITPPVPLQLQVN